MSVALMRTYLGTLIRASIFFKVAIGIIFFCCIDTAQASIKWQWDGKYNAKWDFKSSYPQFQFINYYNVKD